MRVLWLELCSELETGGTRSDTGTCLGKGGLPRALTGLKGASYPSVAACCKSE